MKVTSERIRNIIPAAIARLAIHVQTSSASFSTSLPSSGAVSTGPEALERFPEYEELCAATPEPRGYGGA
jgi:hypothetical protein